MKEFYLGIAFYSFVWAFGGPLFLGEGWNMYAWAFNISIFMLAMALRLRASNGKSAKPKRNWPGERPPEQDKTLSPGHPFIKQLDQEVCMVPWCECGNVKAVRFGDGWEIEAQRAQEK